MKLADKIFSLFGSYEKSRDVNKDAEGRGLLERFVRACAEEYDDYFNPAIANLLDNTIIPDKALVKFIPYLENVFGLFPSPAGLGELILFNSEASRRKILSHILQLYKIKGTNTAWRILFKMLGFSDVIITETYPGNSFDSDYTLDDSGRRFDGTCPGCSNYYLDLLGTITLTPELVQGIWSVIRWNEPLNARNRGVTYNGGYLVDVIISVYINDDGDLIYNNAYDPELILTLSPEGDLLVNGPNKAHYKLNENGDLIYQV